MCSESGSPALSAMYDELIDTIRWEVIQNALRMGSKAFRSVWA